MSVNEVKNKRAPIEFQIRGTETHGYSRTFCIGDEDHTLGNALRHVMMQNSKVGFAAYSVPHPSEPVVHIRVQTATPILEEEVQISAIDALKEACETLIEQCELVLEKVEETMPEVREDRIKLEEIVANEGADEDDDDGEELADKEDADGYEDGVEVMDDEAY
uniref:DNA-directed RNA polymerase RBP11-like dimerisation domain-containing protein n=1 Tax=Eucampia antarctica TaxID=49252 RepID=A0A7S2S2T8_9STRA|eukprot:CAMPEP_0197829182 /NCGR_PEP_ID=MMETSP1437-20131217/5633_1 /TAXON_ID=49252 ORGANISM="Eucampia antarctica, Strain CCMP1452" /NCGR_SAMPLE_ID=MMETSP1437 /ASSEMBLY_ACC=CAM_ASM_001096 /LENGTH=162 /DNA_ID=CAMNT_0043430715 /DNA_START=26 /DNA_END=517 /DNA_ORIENTATION=+